MYIYEYVYLIYIYIYIYVIIYIYIMIIYVSIHIIHVCSTKHIIIYWMSLIKTTLRWYCIHWYVTFITLYIYIYTVYIYYNYITVIWWKIWCFSSKQGKLLANHLPSVRIFQLRSQRGSRKLPQLQSFGWVQFTLSNLDKIKCATSKICIFI